jgi:hypothetical protein
MHMTLICTRNNLQCLLKQNRNHVYLMLKPGHWDSLGGSTALQATGRQHSLAKLCVQNRKIRIVVLHSNYEADQIYLMIIWLGY